MKQNPIFKTVQHISPSAIRPDLYFALANSNTGKYILC